MPTYEYICRACGHEFERFQKITADPVKDCPECGEARAERRISAGGGLVFKGPGFYATDYRKDGPSGEGKEPKEGKRSKEARGSKEADGSGGGQAGGGSGSGSGGTGGTKATGS